jgi:hypothetical protein
MTDTHTRARIAGAIYVIASAMAVIALMLQSPLIVSGDPAASMAHIRAAEGQFRLGVGFELLGDTLWVFVVWALWRLLGEVDRRQSWLMVVLGLIITPISFVAAAPELAALQVIVDPKYAAAFPPAQLTQLYALMMRLHGLLVTVDEIFWGVWLFPFGVLVWKSGFLPKALGALLILGGVGWVLQAGTAIVAPALLPAIGPWANGMAQIGELPTLAWLLIMGARTGFSLRPAAAAAA